MPRLLEWYPGMVANDLPVSGRYTQAGWGLLAGSGTTTAGFGGPEGTLPQQFRPRPLPHCAVCGDATVGYERRIYGWYAHTLWYCHRHEGAAVRVAWDHLLAKLVGQRGGVDPRLNLRCCGGCFDRNSTPVWASGGLCRESAFTWTTWRDVALDSDDLLLWGGAPLTQQRAEDGLWLHRFEYQQHRLQAARYLLLLFCPSHFNAVRPATLGSTAYHLTPATWDVDSVVQRSET